MPRSGTQSDPVCPVANSEKQATTALGDPQSVDSFALEQGVGYAPVSLPASITGAAITRLLSIGSKKKFYRYVLPVFFLLFLSLVLNICMIYGVEEAVDESEKSCEEGSWLLRVGCVAVFILLMMTALKECLDIHRWLYRIPRSTTYQTLRLQKHHTHHVLTVADGRRRAEVTWYEAATGMTRRERCLIYMLMLFPKVVVSVVLIVYGTAYVLYAGSNEDLVLNSVAMAFISDLDKFIYELFLSTTAKTLLSSLPPLGLAKSELNSHKMGFFVEVYGVWLATSVQVVLMALLITSWCRV